MYTSVNRQKVSKLSANFEERMEAMRKKDDVLEIGVLNLMHDKEDTKRRFERVLTREDRRVNLTWFYPVMHYQDREVPENVRQMSQPLDLDKVKGLDAFIERVRRLKSWTSMMSHISANCRSCLTV